MSDSIVSFQIMVTYRGKNEAHLEWVKLLKDLMLNGLREYVKKFHHHGPSWRKAGNKRPNVDTQGMYEKITLEGKFQTYKPTSNVN